MWSRALAGLVPGFFLAAAITGLLCWLPPGAWQQTLVPGLVVFFPVWTGVAIVAFFFANGRRAWCWLTLAAVAATALLWGLKALHWVQ
jgi:hypothetical protein